MGTRLAPGETICTVVVTDDDDLIARGHPLVTLRRPSRLDMDEFLARFHRGERVGSADSDARNADHCSTLQDHAKFWNDFSTSAIVFPMMGPDDNDSWAVTVAEPLSTIPVTDAPNVPSAVPSACTVVV